MPLGRRWLVAVSELSSSRDREGRIELTWSRYETKPTVVSAADGRSVTIAEPTEVRTVEVLSYRTTEERDAILAVIDAAKSLDQSCIDGGTQ